MQVLHTELGDSKYRPCPLLVNYVNAGYLGKKVGRGFYKYWLWFMSLFCKTSYLVSLTAPLFDVWDWKDSNNLLCFVLIGEND